MKGAANYTRNKPKPKANSDSSRTPNLIDEAAVEQFLQSLVSGSTFIIPGEPKLEINGDVVKRVTKGAIGEVLVFLAEHMRGREEVRKVRGAIQAAVSSSGEGNRGMNMDVHPALVDLEKAKRRLKAARTAVEVARREREEERNRHEALRESFLLWIDWEGADGGEIL